LRRLRRYFRCFGLFIEIAAEFRNRLGRCHFKFVKVIEDLVNAVDGGIRFQALGLLSEGRKLASLLWIYLDISGLQLVVISHNEEEHGASNALGFVELKLGQ